MGDIPIVVAYGDGIGPEIMEAVLYILKEAKPPLKISTIEIGEKIYKKNYTSGITETSWKIIESSAAILKAPITTPQGKGYKSLNVTLRKALGLYANIRPVISYHPFVKTLHPKLDLVIIRENEEDLYTGIEYRQTANMYQALKLISKTGSEKIIRYAFDYAIKHNRKKVSCFTKDNIMKMTDGVFHNIFDKISNKYNDIETNHFIIDIGTAKVASSPEIFDVIVTLNLYGDIISDVAAEISGSVGLAGSANIGDTYAMFEAIHGSAPDIAGKQIANPSGLLNAAIMMLHYLKQPEIAIKIENAWKRTLEDGLHTADIYDDKISKQKLSTKDFAHAVVERLGKEPSTLKKASYSLSEKVINSSVSDVTKDEKKQLIGVDVYIDYKTISVEEVAAKLPSIENLKLSFISIKGLKIWPHPNPIKIFSDHYCCRFISNSSSKKECSHQDIIALLSELSARNLDFIKIENLYQFDGKNGFSLAQGE